MSQDIFASATAFLVTVMILSYLLGDNPAFRVAVHVFVGVTAGYVAAVAWWQVLLPDLILPIVTGSAATRAGLAVPLLLCGMLLMKGWPPLSRLGSPALALLVGAASAVAIGGAVQGTLLPQVASTLESMEPANIVTLEAMLNATLVLLGVVTSLTYFHFSARLNAEGAPRRAGIVELGAGIGAVFLAVTLGVLFAGVYAAALTAFIERFHSILTFFGAG